MIDVTKVRQLKTASLRRQAESLIADSFHKGYVYGVKVGKGARSEADMERDIAGMTREPEERTRADVLLEMFPFVEKEYPGNYPAVCVGNVGRLFGHRKVARCIDHERCRDCWNMPYDGEFEVSCP